MSKTLKRGKHFNLTVKGGQFWVHLNDPKAATPAGRRVGKSDANYLLHECGQSFDHACVLDFGVGIFERKK